MNKLLITSCLAENTNAAVRAVAKYVEAQIGIQTQHVLDVDWPAREEGLDSGEIQIGWICGLLYVKQTARPRPPVELLAAPVMSHSRYHELPIYYSDVIVGLHSSFGSFADLEGSRWAYNEVDSYSGYGVVCGQLMKQNLALNYFGQITESGSHLNSLKMVADGRADFAAIDSTLLDYEIGKRASYTGNIRVIDSLGPSPIPPWVISLSVPENLRNRLRNLLLNMDKDSAGRSVLANSQLSRFTATDDSEYEVIRKVNQAADSAASS